MDLIKSYRVSRSLPVTFVLAILILTLPGVSRADPEVATLYSLEGQAERRLAGAGDWKPCAVGQAFSLGDEIRVGDYSRAGIQFTDGMFVRLSSKASLRFDRSRAANLQGSVFLESGKGHFLNREPLDGLQVQTAVVSAAIRGTEFVIEASSQAATISVIEGAVDAENKFGRVALQSSEQATTLKGKAPVKALTFSPADAVQWTAEVPVILDWDLYEQSSALRGHIRSVAEHAQAGELSSALKSLRQLPKSPARGLLETDLLIAMGQIDEASTLALSETFETTALTGHAHAQCALLALARNDINRAADEMVQARAHSAGGIGVALASSLVLQSRKDLNGALAAIQDGLSAHPGNPGLLARKSELELGFGQRDEALVDAEKSLQGDPRNGYAQAVLGFIKLMQGQTAEARSAFEAAQASAPGSGLPFLGLGLTKIHDGDLSAGKVDLQRAVHLEPSRAVFRSYLGKAFFELEDEKLSKREYDEAIRLDPNDPTPYLYRGFYQISQNRLVDALGDIETSFAKNDNRAVFRSSLLLDEDSAVRSAGLSKVFTELGFTEAGRIEAIQALNADPSNFSAHRLLADSQSALFYADATLSERRIADLLAPISFNLFSALGGQASLNEYDSLFDQSLHRSGLNLRYDESSDAFIGEVSNSGKSGNLGYAVSAASIYGHGSKSKDYLRDYRADAALRYQLQPNHRLLLDAHGFFRQDRSVAFESAEDTTELDSGGVNFGYSFRAGPGLTILSELAVSRERLLTSSFPSERSIDSVQIFEGVEDSLVDDLILDQRTREYVTAFRQGSQALYRADPFSIVFGYQVLHETPNRSESSLVVDDSLGELTDQGLLLSSMSSPELTATDIYLYPTFHLASWLDLTAGVTRTDLETAREVSPFFEDTDSQGRWNPKVGITAKPFPGLTLRGAYFENLRKSSLEDQISLEPTLVSGISQRFNDLSGTRSRNFGLGLNYKTPGATYIGGEYIRRYPTERIANASTALVTDFDAEDQYVALQQDPIAENHVEQDLARAYIYQVLSPSLVATLDYAYATEELTDQDLFSDFLAHTAAAQLRYFHPCGAFLFSRATWRKQSGVNDALLGDGQAIGWMLDAGIGYRLPHRRGTLTFEVLNLNDENAVFDQTRGFEDYIPNERAFRLSANLNF